MDKLFSLIHGYGLGAVFKTFMDSNGPSSVQI